MKSVERVREGIACLLRVRWSNNAIFAEKN
jgi:hypothetical protein